MFMSYENPKITLNDSMIDVIVKLSDGNPGAATALMELIKYTPVIDKDSALGSWGPLFDLDNLDIYGPNIYVLWNDQCLRNAQRFILLLRSVQLGLFPRERLKTISEDQMRSSIIPGEEFEELEKQVLEQLPDFMSKEEFEKLEV